MRFPSLSAVAVAVCVLAGLPASAAASKVSHIPILGMPGLSTYTGVPGEVNRVTVSRDVAGDVVFTEAGGHTITNDSPFSIKLK